MAKKDYIEGHAEEHVKAIQTYWKKQDGDTVERWTKTAEALEGLSEKVKRYAGDNNSSFAGFCF